MDIKQPLLLYWLSRNNTYTNPIFPLGGSQFSISAKLSFPYSLVNKIDYANLGDQPAFQNADGTPMMQKLTGKFKWLEYYKLKFSGSWYTNIIDKLVLKTHSEFGYLGAYNTDRGIIPLSVFI